MSRVSSEALQHAGETRVSPRSYVKEHRMRSSSLLILIIAATALAAHVVDADAKRLGGGRSLGVPRQASPPSTTSPASPTTPSGAASNPVMPAQPGSGINRPATPPATPATPRWLAPVAGLAAGLGLAALLSHFGLSESFAGILLLVLLHAGAFVVLRLLMSRRAADPMQYAPAASDGARILDRDAPPERIEPVLASPPGEAGKARVPADFSAGPFLEEAKRQFRLLQAAYDRGDRVELARVMTPAMLAEIERDLDQRDAHVPTEVVMLDATLLDVSTEEDAYWASVRFSGMLKEDGALLPQSFEETWNLKKPLDGSSGWLLAGIEQREQIA